jgi:type VI secretion system secreted protein Hcp
MAIYMKFGSATGDVTEAAHSGQIELLDVRWSMSRTIRSAVGVGKNRESTSAYVSEITVTKYIDSASSSIAQSAFVGEGESCTIDFTRVNKGQEAVFRKITLTDAIISGLVNHGSGSERPVETLTLNFTQIAITDTVEAASGTAGSNSTVTYDLTKSQTT